MEGRGKKELPDGSERGKGQSPKGTQKKSHSVQKNAGREEVVWTENISCWSG